MKKIYLTIDTIKYYALIATTSLLTYSGIFAQEQANNEAIWVTVDNIQDVPERDGMKLVSENESIQNLIDQFGIYQFERALYYTEDENLQKVYEVSCLCDIQDLYAEMAERTEGLTKPEMAPSYKLLDDPNDYTAVFVGDYSLDLINAKEAWDITTGDPNVVVGISDGNFSPDHEEIEGQDYYVNFSGTYPYQNYYMHGNSVAITAAGATDNGIGKSSIGRDCKLAMVGLTYDMVLHLSQMNIPVVNMSWASSCSPSSYVQSVINEIHANGTTLVAAAGNGNTCGGATNLVYPAAYEHVIAVSSVGPYDNHLMWNTTHQHNASVDLVAPGFGVAISYGPNWYSWGSGTSYSAPFVTGTIGLMLSVNPCLTSEEIEYILKETAVNVDALNPQFAGQLGAGRLDSEAAVLMAQSYVCEQNGNGNGNGNGNDGNNSGGLGGNGNGNNGNTNGNPNNGNIDTEPINGNHYNVHGNGNNDEFGDGNNGHGNDPGNFDRSNPGNRAPAVQGELNQNDSPVINNFDAVLYPNPTASEVNIKWNIQQEMTLRLIDAKGMIIQEKEINAQTSRVSIELPSSGFYIAYLEKDGETVWKDRVTRK